jgi:hypothetical protein
MKLKKFNVVSHETSEIEKSDFLQRTASSKRQHISAFLSGAQDVFIEGSDLFTQDSKYISSYFRIVNAHPKFKLKTFRLDQFRMFAQRKKSQDLTLFFKQLNHELKFSYLTSYKGPSLNPIVNRFSILNKKLGEEIAPLIGTQTAEELQSLNATNITLFSLCEALFEAQVFNQESHVSLEEVISVLREIVACRFEDLRHKSFSLYDGKSLCLKSPPNHYEFDIPQLRTRDGDLVGRMFEGGLITTAIGYDQSMFNCMFYMIAQFRAFRDNPNHIERMLKSFLMDHYLRYVMHQCDARTFCGEQMTDKRFQGLMNNERTFNTKKAIQIPSLFCANYIDPEILLTFASVCLDLDVIKEEGTLNKLAQIDAKYPWLFRDYVQQQVDMAQILFRFELPRAFSTVRNLESPFLKQK